MPRYMFKGHNVKHLLVHETESVIWKRFISFAWPHGSVNMIYLFSLCPFAKNLFNLTSDNRNQYDFFSRFQVFKGDR